MLVFNQKIIFFGVLYFICINKNRIQNLKYMPNTIYIIYIYIYIIQI